MTREQSLDTFLRAANGAGLVGLYEAAAERITPRTEASHG